MAKDCPSPQKGGGKGGKGYKGGSWGKSAGKGGKGPLGGCWKCGGAHYAVDCPNPSAKGGGKGKGKLGSFEFQESEWDGGNEEDSVRYLSSLTLKRPPIPTSNYWGKLEEENEVDTPTGVAEQADAASSSVGSVSGASAGKSGRLGHAGGVSYVAGVDSSLSGGPKGGHAAEGALSAPSRGVSTQRVLGNMLAQEYAPPPAAITGREMMAVATRKVSQGQRKRRLR